MHASINIYTHTPAHVDTDGQRLVMYLHGDTDGKREVWREDVEREKEGRDEIEGHLRRC